MLLLWAKSTKLRLFQWDSSAIIKSVFCFLISRSREVGLRLTLCSTPCLCILFYRLYGGNCYSLRMGSDRPLIYSQPSSDSYSRLSICSAILNLGYCFRVTVVEISFCSRLRDSFASRKTLLRTNGLSFSLWSCKWTGLRYSSYFLKFICTVRASVSNSLLSSITLLEA